jgi:hypothetical protein
MEAVMQLRKTRYNKQRTALNLTFTCYTEQEQRVNNADASGILPLRWSNTNMTASTSMIAQYPEINHDCYFSYPSQFTIQSCTV